MKNRTKCFATLCGSMERNIRSNNGIEPFPLFPLTAAIAKLIREEQIMMSRNSNSK